MLQKGNSNRGNEKKSYFTKQIKPDIEALKIIFIYLFIGCSWILISDHILAILVNNEKIFSQIQLYKGWFYVVVTGGIFYNIIRKKLLLYDKAMDTILYAYEEIETAHEEMIAMNEELIDKNSELENQKNTTMISEQRYALAVEGANDGIWDWDLKTDVYFFSIKWKNALGYAGNELENTVDVWEKLCHQQDRERVFSTVRKYLKEARGFYECTYRLRRKSGEYRWVLSRGKGIWDVDGSPIRMAGSHTDITDQMHLQELLSAEKELSEGIILDAPMIIIVLDENEKIIQFNPYAEDVLCYKREEVLGKNSKDMHGLFFEFSEENPLTDNEIDIRCKDGKYRTILWNKNLLHDKQGKTKGIVLMGMDITERREMEDKLQLLAYYDTLTALPNRILFESEVSKMIECHDKFALVNVDIDDFKHLNDTLGHSIGDSIMRHISRVLSEAVLESGIVARLSGDQFALLSVLSDDDTDLSEKMEELISKIRTPWCVDGHTYYVTVTMGVAIYPENGTDFQTMMQKSEIAMFNGKENGKDGYTIFEDAMYEKALYYIQMSNQLRKAIENEEFMLYYQPQYDLKTGRIIGVEALIRWNHSERGFISPMEFITFSEKTGQIVPIDKWVLKTAIYQKKEWDKKGYPPIKMAINISGYILTKKDIMKEICDFLKKMDLKPGEIEVEVTETAVMMELDIAKKSLEKLKEIGILIALDDFGTGYSSLTYLNSLPFDVLKIDREFIKDISREDENVYLYKAVIDLAHDMNLQVVAEGIETREQEKFLLKNNCDIGQGYYLSKPMPASEIERLF